MLEPSSWLSLPSKYSKLVLSAPPLIPTASLVQFLKSGTAFSPLMD